MRPLTIEQIERARVAVLENATQLIEEAEVLIRANRTARAFSLAHLACEEFAKLPMLVRVGLEVVRGKKTDWSKFYRRFRSHSEKLDNLHATDYFFSDVRAGDKDYADFQAALKTTPAMSREKNSSLYVDFLDGEAQLPAALITGAKATSKLAEARRCLGFFERIEKGTRGRLKDLRGIVDLPALAESVVTSPRGDTPRDGDA